VKFISEKAALIKAYGIVEKAISSKPAMQILQGIYIKADTEKGMVTCIGTDLEMEIENEFSASIVESGSIVIDSKMFGEIIRKLPDADVTIETEDTKVIITCLFSRFELMGTNPAGYPNMPEIAAENNTLEIESKIIKDMIRQTSFAISVDDKRLVLTGTLIECTDGYIKVVAIDGYRMALRQSKTDCGSFKAIIQGKCVNEVAKILDGTSKVHISMDFNQIIFQWDTVKVVSRLITGEYINYSNVIPKETPTKIKVKTKELLQAIDRAALMAGDDKKRPVKLNIKDDAIVITSDSSTGKTREQVKCEQTGAGLEIGFNPRYLMDALKAIDDDETELRLSSSIGPAVFMPVERDGYVYMCLPVRVEG
jgi:DNA polymerase-3 subunit beta